MGTNTQAGLECWDDPDAQTADFVALNQTEAGSCFPARHDFIRPTAKFCFMGSATALQSPGHACVLWWHRLSNPRLFISPSHTAQGAEQCGAATNPCSQHKQRAEKGTDAHSCASLGHPTRGDPTQPSLAACSKAFLAATATSTHRGQNFLAMGW